MRSKLVLIPIMLQQLCLDYIERSGVDVREVLSAAGFLVPVHYLSRHPVIFYEQIEATAEERKLQTTLTVEFRGVFHVTIAKNQLFGSESIQLERVVSIHQNVADVVRKIEKWKYTLCYHTTSIMSPDFSQKLGELDYWEDLDMIRFISASTIVATLQKRHPQLVIRCRSCLEVRNKETNWSLTPSCIEISHIARVSFDDQKYAVTLSHELLEMEQSMKFLQLVRPEWLRKTGPITVELKEEDSQDPPTDEIDTRIGWLFDSRSQCLPHWDPLNLSLADNEGLEMLKSAMRNQRIELATKTPVVEVILRLFEDSEIMGVGSIEMELGHENLKLHLFGDLGTGSAWELLAEDVELISKVYC